MVWSEWKSFACCSNKWLPNLLKQKTFIPCSSFMVIEGWLWLYFIQSWLWYPGWSVTLLATVIKRENKTVILWLLKILLGGSMSLLLPSHWPKQDTWLCMGSHTFLQGSLIWVTLSQFTMRHCSLSHTVDGQKPGWPKPSKDHIWPQLTFHVYSSALSISAPWTKTNWGVLTLIVSPNSHKN